MRRLCCLALLSHLAPMVASAQALDSAHPATGVQPSASAAPVTPTAGITPGPLLPLGPAYAEMTGETLFAKLQEHHRACEASLREYSSTRTYSVVNDKGRTVAQEVIQMTFHAPDNKTFVVKSGSGSSLVRGLVLDRLVQSEKETASGRAHRESEVTPENYSLKLVGEQNVGPHHCLVAQAIPKRRDRYLFEGKVWISSDDFGIVRMAGRPAKPLSFWLTRAEFARQYQKVGDFWLPAEDETLAQIRFNGKRMMIVKYDDYRVNGTSAASASPGTSTP